MHAIITTDNVDCIVYNAICCVNNSHIKKLCKFGIEFEYGDKQNGEDIDWVKSAYLDIKTQHRIDKVLYYYDANYNTTSETANLSDDVIMKNIDILLNNT